MNFRTVKPREPGSTADLVARSFEAAGGVNRVAHVLGIGMTQAYAYSDPQSGQQVKLDDVRRLAEAFPAVAKVVAEDFAATSGATLLVYDAEDRPTLGDLLAREELQHGVAIAKLMRRLNEHALGKLSLKERKDLRQEFLAMMQPLSQVLAVLSRED